MIINMRKDGKYIGEYQDTPKHEGQSPDIYSIMHPKGGQRVEIDGKTYVFTNKSDADEYNKYYAHEVRMGWATEPIPFWKA